MRQPNSVFGGVEMDSDIKSGLDWLADASGHEAQFWARLEAAQQTYRTLIADAEVFGQDPSWEDLGPDRVSAYLAQAKSLLDDRASYDFVLISHVAPWIKQLGSNLKTLERIDGARERARRMVQNATVSPNTALFELVMAGNYANAGFDVAFINEGAKKSPDLLLSNTRTNEQIVVELKRLQRGQYEIEERRRQGEIFDRVEAMIHDRELSVDIDVTYDRELKDVPDDYLALILGRSLSSPIIVQNGYPWKDAFGSGVIRAANVDAVHRDTRDSYLYFGTKMAKLLAGRPISEQNYNLAARASSNRDDRRYIDRIYYGSVLTWRSSAPVAIQRKAKYVRSKLHEADLQIAGHGAGVVHIAMDAELDGVVSDLRRRRNLDAVRGYRMESDTRIVYLHYVIPRISENHSWVIDETVDVFSRFSNPTPPFPAFPAAPKLKNGLPAWHQTVGPS